MYASENFVILCWLINLYRDLTCNFSRKRKDDGTRSASNIPHSSRRSGEYVLLETAAPFESGKQDLMDK